MPLADCVHRLRASCTICGREAPFTIHTTPVTNYNWVGGPETHALLCRFYWVQLDIIQDTVYASLPGRGSGQTLFGGPRLPEKLSSIKNTTKTKERVKGRPVEPIIDAGAVYSVISEDMIQKLERSDELIPSNEEFIDASRGRGRQLGVLPKLKTQMENLTRLLDARVVCTNAHDALFVLDWLCSTGTHITSNDQKGRLLCADEALDTETV